MGNLDSLKSTKTILLTTYRRDGSPVATPVSIAFDQERAYFRSFDQAGKTSRLRNLPVVQAAPCTLRGRVTGQAIQARAALLSGEDAKRAASALARTHPVLQGFLVPVLHRLMRYRTLHYELSPASSSLSSS